MSISASAAPTVPDAGGACRWVCATGWADCDGNAGNGCEVDLTASTASCGRCGNACPSPPNTTGGRCVGGACGFACSAGFEDCNGVPGDGCETNLQNDRLNCGACGNACPLGPCVAAVCSSSIHNTLSYTGTNTAASTCTYGGVGPVRWDNLGAMPWRACVVEASRRGAMLCAQQYTVPLGWYAHRNGANAMTGVWSSYRAAAIITSVACIVGRDPVATRRDVPLASTVTYDGQVWHYEDYGLRYYDECQTLAGNAGAMVITPYTIGRTGDGYWSYTAHACNTYEWITGSGNAFTYESLSAGARSTRHGCMVGYVDN